MLLQLCSESLLLFKVKEVDPSGEQQNAGQALSLWSVWVLILQTPVDLKPYIEREDSWIEEEGFYFHSELRFLL